MSFLYLTADRIGTETGGGLVTKHESDALKSLGAARVISRAEIEAAARQNGVGIPGPWGWDDVVSESMYPMMAWPENKAVTLCHAYAGTFGKTVKKLKDAGAKVCYTIAAHDRFVSREEHERLGMIFPYAHLTDEALWQRYIEGYRLADVIVCPGTVPAATVRAYGPEFAAKRIEIIPHGCELPETVAPLPTAFVLGYCGVSGCDKGLVYLLQAWKKLAYKDAMLVIGGSGSMSPFMYQLVDHFGGGNIHLAGWQTDMSRFYNGLSCYCQCSSTEGFGCEISEAMAHARPVLCSTGAGAVDLVPPTRRFEARNVDDLATQINRVKMLGREGLAAEGSGDRERVKEVTWDKIRERYCELWRSMC